jgi:thiol-disulfide isomerase/thioredoxin
MSRFRLLATAVSLIVTGATVGAQATPAPAAVSTADSVHVIDITAKPNDDLGKILQAEYATAIKGGRTPIVELGATWCGPCKHVAASLGDARMKDAFAGMYVIRLDIDQWKEKLAPLGFDASAIPAFFPINDQGKVIGPKIDGGAWGEDIPENMAPPLKKFFVANVNKDAVAAAAKK